jgi:hypothetical protein
MFPLSVFKLIKLERIFRGYIINLKKKYYGLPKPLKINI